MFVLLLAFVMVFELRVQDGVNTESRYCFCSSSGLVRIFEPRRKR